MTPQRSVKTSTIKGELALPLSIRQIRLQEFVDRRIELAEFCEMLESGERPVMVISGISGIGKSSLLARLVEECADRRVARVEINCKDSRHGSYLKIMSAIVESLGIEHFQQFARLVEYFGNPQQGLLAIVPADINIRSDLSVGTVKPGASVAGVVIEQLNISVSDTRVPEAERIAPLTDRFLADLAPLLGKDRIAFFFDQVESATTETRKWIWEELFRPIRQGGLVGARFVLCVQESPESAAEIGDLRPLVKRSVLKPFGDGDIAEYVARRQKRSTAAECLPVAEALFLQTKGLPADVVTSVDALIEFQKVKAASGT
jgi:hypothetical protein